MTTQDNKEDMIVKIVSVYAARPDVTADDIAALTLKLTQSLDGVPAAPMPVAAPAALPTVSEVSETKDMVPAVAPGTSIPAVSPDKAVTRSKVYCMCCGKGFKMLKRHIRAEHGLTEEQYRAKFGLPDDFPLVAPEYSEMKANSAKKLGLGKYDRNRADAVD